MDKGKYDYSICDWSPMCSMRDVAEELDMDVREVWAAIRKFERRLAQRIKKHE